MKNDVALKNLKALKTLLNTIKARKLNCVRPHLTPRLNEKRPIMARCVGGGGEKDLEAGLGLSGVITSRSGQGTA